MDRNTKSEIRSAKALLISANIGAICFFACCNQAALAADFTITGAEITTNGGNTLNGDDRITVTNTGSVTPAANTSALLSTGNSNTLTNDGTLTVSGSNSYAIHHLGDGGTISNTNTINIGSANGVGLFFAGQQWYRD